MQVETTDRPVLHQATCSPPTELAAGFAILLVLFTTDARAQSRTFYGADGKVLGRSITDSDGVTTYYDAAGRITGRTSADGDTMTIYGADGRVIIIVTKPQGK